MTDSEENSRKIKFEYVGLTPTNIFAVLDKPMHITEFAEYMACIYELFYGIPALVEDVSHEIYPEDIYPEEMSAVYPEILENIDTILALGTEKDSKLFLIPGKWSPESNVFQIKQHSFYDPYHESYESDELPKEIQELYKKLVSVAESQHEH